MRASVILLIFAIVALAFGQSPPNVTRRPYTHGNGKPGCQTTEEVGVKWRNNWDPIRYWVCQGNAAVSYICPTEFMFNFDTQCCIRWNFWVWTPPFDPPTLATN